MAIAGITYGGHAVCESTKLKATIAGHIMNVKIGADMDNGSLVSLGAYQGQDVYAAGAVAAGTTPYLVLSVPLIYEQLNSRIQDPSNFYNANGDIVRAYELHVGDVFAVSDEAFNGTPEANATVGGEAGKNYIKVSGADGFTGKIIGKDHKGLWLVNVTAIGTSA